MGLLRASLITGVIYTIWQLLEARVMHQLPDAFRAKWVPLLPLALVFVVEILL